MANPTAPSQVPAGPTHRQRRNRRFQFAQTVLSMMSALIGVSLGTATGISLAMVSTPADAAITLNDLRQIHFIGNEAPVNASARPGATITPNPGASSSPVEHAQPNAAIQTVANASQPVADGGKSGGVPAISGASPVAPAEAVGHSPAVQPGPSKIPVVDENESPIHPAAPAEGRPAKPAVHPLTKPRRIVLASAEINDSVSAPIDNEQMSLDGGTRLPTFYSEGDLTIADYDAGKGTIETNDGRTFVLGLTVSTAGATGWEDYHSSVHYRCSQDGSCMLTRLGAVAPNARLI